MMRGLPLLLSAIIGCGGTPCHQNYGREAAETWFGHRIREFRIYEPPNDANLAAACGLNSNGDPNGGCLIAHTAVVGSSTMPIECAIVAHEAGHIILRELRDPSWQSHDHEFFLTDRPLRLCSTVEKECSE